MDARERAVKRVRGDDAITTKIGPVALHATKERSPQGAEMEGVLAVALLCAAPGRVTHNVDAEATEVVATKRAEFTPHRVADSFLQLDIPAGAPSHRHRECGRAR